MEVSSESRRGYTKYGFLTQEPPLRQLPLPFCQWESLLKEAQVAVRTLKRISTACESELDYTMSQWRRQVRQMRVIRFEPQRCLEAVSHRAHHVLTFLVQYYIQSQSEEARNRGTVVRIPASLAVPLVAVSRHLGIAPILTYADTVLWNWKWIDPKKAVSVQNVGMIDLFTNDSQEEHFFLTSLRMEICGRASTKAMLEMSQSRSKRSDGDDDHRQLVENVRTIARNLDELTDIFCAVREGLTPDFFYNDFRPWIQGADQGIESPSWLYEGTGLILQPSGPSAGQSAMMHSFDVFLGIEHPHSSYAPGSGCAYINSALNPHREVREGKTIASRCPRSGGNDKPQVHQSVSHCFSHGSRSTQSQVRCPASNHSIPSERSSAQSNEVDTSFNARMRTYMPIQHQEYLLWLKEHTPFRHTREPVLKSQAALEAHGAAVRALQRWRNAHIQVVTQYVILPARRKFCLEAQAAAMAENSTPRRECPAAEIDESTTKQVVRGTGGTSLIPLLKIYRENTRNAAVGSALMHPAKEITRVQRGPFDLLWWLLSFFAVGGLLLRDVTEFLQKLLGAMVTFDKAGESGLMVMLCSLWSHILVAIDN